MDTLTKRTLLFLIGCIGMRSLLVYLAKTLPMNQVRIMGYLALIPAIGFAYIYLTGSRTTGGEVFGEKIWWNSLRPIHSLLYGTFALMAITGNRSAWIALLLDVSIGLLSFIAQRTGLAF